MIDIIVPIYEGFEQTKECIKSIRKFYNSEKHRILLINDCSPNVEINDYLKELLFDNFLILNNKKNLGFIQTVNRGIKLSEKNDVILLNSDTIVTKNWTQKLQVAAYSSKKIGTVTTLTNNGTIVSVPCFNQDNILPLNYTIDSFAQLIEDSSEKKYPTIPTCVGHAVYIKRELINKIGLLDAETFGKGYGEENDFSARAILAGYKNVVADDTFIYHYGSTSFGKDKISYVNEHKRILYKRYWWYPYLFKYFMYLNFDMKKICKNIQSKI